MTVFHSCYNDGTCIDNMYSYQCVCKTGFTGQNCESNIECGTLASIGNGDVEIDKNSAGGIATYSCDSGFFLAGNRHRTCMDNGPWGGTVPSCSENPVTSYEVIGRTVSCTQVQIMRTLTHGQLLTCIDIFVNESIRFANGHTCKTSSWKSWSSTTKQIRVDVPSVCHILGQHLWGLATVMDTQVLSACDTAQSRGTFINHEWSTHKDSGYIKSMKYLFTV